MTVSKKTNPKHNVLISNSLFKSKGDNKRDELLDEAAKILNRNGVSQASLTTIAKNVGVSRAALYYYVKDQKDLVFQCYVRACEQLAGLIEISTQYSNDTLVVIDNFVEIALAEDRPEFASLSDVAFLSEQQRSIVLGLYKGVRLSLADVLTKGINQGQLRPCNTRIVASIILGLIAWVPVAMRWRPEKSENYNAFKQNIRDILKNGIAHNRDTLENIHNFDLSSFFTVTGNVFDLEARIAARRETLLLVASWLFNQKGVEATSLEEIAAQVGVTKKVIYHNIGGKNELISECSRRAFRFFQFVAECANQYNGTRLNALCNSLSTLATASVRKDIAPMLPITGRDAWTKETRKEMFTAVDKLIERGKSIYQAGMKEGSIRSIDEESLLLMRPGFYEWMPRWGISLDDSELLNAPSEITNVFRNGLAPL